MGRGVLGLEELALGKLMTIECDSKLITSSLSIQQLLRQLYRSVVLFFLTSLHFTLGFLTQYLHDYS